MYNANASYEENYARGPDKNYLRNRHFPILEYLESPQYDFLGVPLHIPFGVAAGPLLNADYVRVALNAGFCLPVYKTVRSVAWECNKWPNILSLKSENKSLYAEENNLVIGELFSESDYLNKKISISNSFGVPSQSVDKWQSDLATLKDYSTKKGYHVSLSFQGSRLLGASTKETTENFYKDVLKITEIACEGILASGFSIIEMNLSCPNEAQAPLYKDLKSAIATINCAYKIISELKSKVKLVVKLGVLNAEETRIFLGETAGRIDAVSAINTVSAKITQKNGYPALGNGSLNGGVCGSYIFDQGLEMVALLCETREKLGIQKSDLGIIGVGGVVSAKEFASYRSAGADIVQAATGMMWNLDLASEIANHLKVPCQLS
ncbi:hypothetical protein [Fluviispira vulneris]|uniref:hypothetical protein n=1 Tax=Fluviispira vulneris TaxID=2763012 RepID=UPI0016480737|nr:hypothetical protein [Fluviispira vulneris]